MPARLSLANDISHVFKKISLKPKLYKPFYHFVRLPFILNSSVIEERGDHWKIWIFGCF